MCKGNSFTVGIFPLQERLEPGTSRSVGLLLTLWANGATVGSGIQNNIKINADGRSVEVRTASEKQ